MAREKIRPEVILERGAAFRRNFVFAKGKTTEEAVANLKMRIVEELLPRLMDIQEIEEGGLVIDPINPLAACACGCSCGGGDGAGGGSGS